MSDNVLRNLPTDFPRQGEAPYHPPKAMHPDLLPHSRGSSPYGMDSTHSSRMHPPTSSSPYDSPQYAPYPPPGYPMPPGYPAYPSPPPAPPPAAEVPRARTLQETRWLAQRAALEEEAELVRSRRKPWFRVGEVVVILALVFLTAYLLWVNCRLAASVKDLRDRVYTTHPSAQPPSPAPPGGFQDFYARPALESISRGGGGGGTFAHFLQPRSAPIPYPVSPLQVPYM